VWNRKIDGTLALLMRGPRTDECSRAKDGLLTELTQGSSLLPSSLEVAGSAKSRPRRPFVGWMGTERVGGG